MGVRASQSDSQPRSGVPPLRAWACSERRTYSWRTPTMLRLAVGSHSDSDIFASSASMNAPGASCRRSTSASSAGRRRNHRGRRCEWYEDGQQGGLVDEQGDLWSPEHHGRVPLSEPGQVGLCRRGREPAQPLSELLGRADDQHIPIMFEASRPRRSCSRRPNFVSRFRGSMNR